MRVNDLETGQMNGTVPWRDPVREAVSYVVFKDAYPVTIGHLLFVPKWNDHAGIMIALAAAFKEGKRQRELGEIQGFNVGLNQGFAAGQTCDHPHVHFIPRRDGDMKDPTGGVRHVIPERGNYKTSKEYQ